MTQEGVRCRFYWPGWREGLDDYCIGCSVCEDGKHPNKTRYIPLGSNKAGLKMDKIGMDIYGIHTGVGFLKQLYIGSALSQY